MAALCFGYFTSGERRPWHLLKRRLFFFVRVTVHCIYNVLINSSLLYGSETWRLTENNKRREQVKWYICISSQTHIKKNNRRVEATEVDALRRSSRISRKERIRNITIRQQIGLEETIIKEIEQNQLMWYGHVQRMAEGRLPKIALKWMPKQKRA